MKKLPWQLTMEAITDHYNSVYNIADAQPPVFCQQTREGFKNLDDPIRVSEVEDAILSSANNKAPGEDGICNEHLKGSLIVMRESWTAIFNHCLEFSALPADWRRCQTFLLYKGKGDTSDPNNYRAICLQNHVFKCFTKILKDRLQSAVDNLMNENQFGFRKEKSTSDALFVFARSVMPVFEEGKKSLSRYALFVDFSKAFDSVCRQTIVSKLRDRFGINGKFLNLIVTVLQDNEMQLCNLRSNENPTIRQNIGVQQGDSLSPFLFILFADDLLAFLNHKSAGKQIDCVMYADDLLCVITQTAKELKFILRCLQA